jgi:hypothetical protein
MAAAQGYVARIKAVRGGAWRASKRGTGQAGQVRPADDAGEAVSLDCRGAGAALARGSGKGESRAGTGGVRCREEGDKGAVLRSQRPATEKKVRGRFVSERVRERRACGLVKQAGAGRVSASARGMRAWESGRAR